MTRRPVVRTRLRALGGQPLLPLTLVGLVALGAVVAVARFGPTPGTLAPSTTAAAVDDPGAMTVSEVLAARAAGGLQSMSVTVEGYWSDRSVIHSCGAPEGQPGELELYCVDGEFGITELNEPIREYDADFQYTEATSPRLTPYVPNEPAFAPLFNLPFTNGQFYPPVPIIVGGHFDDPRSSDCRAEARQLCADRLVLERVVSFEPDSVPPSTPTPAPTPFPEVTPQALFGPEACSGDVEYSLVGWTTLDELGLDYGPEGPVYAMVTKDVIPMGDWVEGPYGPGEGFRWWGQRICWAQEGQPGMMSFGHVPGTSFKEWRDGRHEPGEAP